MKENNLCRFIDVDDIDHSMTHLENLIQIEDNITYKAFLIGGMGTNNPFYIDERTHKDKNGIYVVKPIAENDKFFWYVCPFCKKIHIESKRYLFIDRPVLNANCIYRNRLIQKLRIIAAASPLAQQNPDDVPGYVLKEEWDFMDKFNNIPPEIKERW